ncbi:MAG: DUF2288 domain-containing protein [Gammaproteobacteria bacterium]|jgi:hypothetical protein
MTAGDENINDEDLVFQKLNLETGQISWSELQRYFARGVVLIVAKELDLVEVAKQFAMDNKDTVQAWMKEALVRNATDEDAKLWNETQQDFWAVVSAPWVLIQVI